MTDSQKDRLNELRGIPNKSPEEEEELARLEAEDQQEEVPSGTTSKSKLAK